MWNFIKSKGNILLKLLLLLFAVMLYMSSSEGISFIMIAFGVLAILLIPIFNNIDKTGLWLILFSFVYCFMLLIYGDYTRVPIFLICPIAFYGFGKNVANRLDDQALIDFLTITVVLFGLKVYIACIMDINEVGLINPSRAMNRSGIGESDMAATLFGLNISLGLAGLVPALVKISPKKHFSMILLFVAFLLSLLTVLHLTNRAGLVVFLLSMMASILYLNPKQNGRFLLAFLVLGIVLYFIIPSTRLFFTDFAESYNQREEYGLDTGFMTMGGRLDRWVDALRRLFVNPFGFNGKTYYSFVHNLWLDVARVGGTIPFVCILFASITGYKQIIRLWKIKNNRVILILVSLSVASFASAFVEPVLEGSDIYFYMMCLIWGIASQYRCKLNTTLSQ